MKSKQLHRSFQHFSLGNISFTDNAGNPIETTHDPKEWAFDVAYSRKLSDRFAISLAGRYIYSDLLSSIDEDTEIEDLWLLILRILSKRYSTIW